MVEGAVYGLSCMCFSSFQAGPTDDAMATARALLANGASALVPVVQCLQEASSQFSSGDANAATRGRALGLMKVLPSPSPSPLHSPLPKTPDEGNPPIT